MSGPIVTLTFPGRTIVKKNTQRVFGSGRFKRRILSARYQTWEQRAANGLVALLNGKRVAVRTVALIDFPVAAHFKFYFKDRQAEADVSNLVEGPQDLLVKLGVLKDDRLVMRIVAEKFFGCDPLDQRCEVEIFKHEVTK